MNIMDIMRLDLKEIEQEYRKLASVLEKLGLSDYEARMYVALVVKNHGSADELAEMSMMPRTSAYKALQSLSAKQYVTSSVGRPTIFYPVPVQEIRSRTLAELNEAFDKLESLKGILSEMGTPQLVYTIAGRKRVMARIGEMIESSQRTFLVSSPVMNDIRTAHGGKFKDAVGRGVDVTILTIPGIKAPDSTRTIRRPELLATDVISDGTSAMIASPDLELCGYSDNPFIAEHLERFIRMAMDRKN